MLYTPLLQLELHAELNILAQMLNTHGKQLVQLIVVQVVHYTIPDLLYTLWRERNWHCEVVQPAIARHQLLCTGGHRSTVSVSESDVCRRRNIPITVDEHTGHLRQHTESTVRHRERSGPLPVLRLHHLITTVLHALHKLRDSLL